MYRSVEEIRRRIMEMVQKFREKGAISPEKAMIIQELGLPPRFYQAMRVGNIYIWWERYLKWEYV